jgi:hypothetical protein
MGGREEHGRGRTAGTRKRRTMVKISPVGVVLITLRITS